MPSICSACGAPVIPTSDNFELRLSFTPTDPQILARIVELSGTNEPPRDYELSLFLPIVDKTRLANLNAEISQLKTSLRQLEEERTALSIYHDENSRIFSPLRRMPPELLGEIFSWTLPSTRDIFDTEDCPWILTRVCSSWRAVALSIPSLWSLIVIDFPAQRRYSLKMISTQIERARSLKIHFFGSQNRRPRRQVALFRLLAEHSTRWEEFSIQLTSHLVPEMNLDFPSLRRAWVQWDTPESQPSEFDSIDFFRTASSLIDIRIFHNFRSLPTRLHLPHQLARYDFDAPWKVHCELLKSLPNLQEVRIVRTFDDNEDWPELGEPIDLSSLRRLYVNDPTCLDYLRAPGLDEIAIGTITGTNTSETARFLEHFLMRSSCSPHCLRIRGLLDAQSMAAILHKYPSFAELVMTDEAPNDEATKREILANFLALFTISNLTPSNMVLPHITKIGFACQDADVAFYTHFVDMLESRRNSGSALMAAELVFLNSRPDPDPLSFVRLETLREDGLQILLLSEDAASDHIGRWFLRTAWV
ncbi:F-box domain-containing protein [Mycena sanguinolenta]|uniref:F-box domain-containing protein n=1 Tax=Mycena sanguinolenta TaxID=230812 RepID=A0A8H6XKB3_9AGAR|nr:F-box domain-containing protein [Mycena sanguinolenta]